MPQRTPQLWPAHLAPAVVLGATLLSCGAPPDAAAPRARPAPADDLELVETWPVETSLDDPAIRDAHAVWVEMIDGARRSLDFLEFYGASADGSRLEEVLDAIDRARARGVRVRFVFDARMLSTNPELPERLGQLEGVEVRIYDFGERGGGVQHAKLFVVDGREVFVGSQNFDWRSLTHIQELGLRIRQPAIVQTFAELFAYDWALASGVERAAAPTGAPRRWPVEVRFEGALARATPGLSPRGWIPDPALWDWPRLHRWIEGARARIRLAVMSYHLRMHDGALWRDLDDALRAAAARGVQVELLVSHWDTREDRVGDLQELARVDGVDVRVVTIPEASGGFVPYARVIHAKYLTIDGARGWVGTSNAAGDYFLRSRNAGLFVEGAAFAGRLDAFFERVSGSRYAAPLDPERDYPPPRVSE